MIDQANCNPFREDPLYAFQFLQLCAGFSAAGTGTVLYRQSVGSPDRKIVLLLLSLIFVSSSGMYHGLIAMGSTLVNFWIYRQMSKSTDRK